MIGAQRNIPEIRADDITDEQIAAFLEILHNSPDFGKCRDEKPRNLWEWMSIPSERRSALDEMNEYWVTENRRKKGGLSVGKLIDKGVTAALIFMLLSWIPGIAHYIKMAPEIAEMTVSYWTEYPAKAVNSDYPENYSYNDFSNFKEYSWGTVCYLKRPWNACDCVVFNETLSELIAIWYAKEAENG